MLAFKSALLSADRVSGTSVSVNSDGFVVYFCVPEGVGVKMPPKMCHYNL